MSLPNMKTFCIATVKPYLQSLYDNFNTRFSHVEKNANFLLDANDKIEEQRTDINNLKKTTSANSTSIAEVKKAVDKVNTKLERIPASRIQEICKNAWTDA